MRENLFLVLAVWIACVGCGGRRNTSQPSDAGDAQVSNDGSEDGGDGSLSNTCPGAKAYFYGAGATGTGMKGAPIRFADLNCDGDALDDGELVVLTDFGYNLGQTAYASGGRLYVLANGQVFVVRDTNGDGTFAASESTLFYTGQARLDDLIVLASGEVAVMEGLNSVVMLQDKNGNSNASDAGERRVFASGISGQALAVGPDGAIYTTEYKLVDSNGNGTAETPAEKIALKIPAGRYGPSSVAVNSKSRVIVKGIVQGSNLDAVWDGLTGTEVFASTGVSDTLDGVTFDAADNLYIYGRTAGIRKHTLNAAGVSTSSTLFASWDSAGSQIYGVKGGLTKAP